MEGFNMSKQELQRPGENSFEEADQLSLVRSKEENRKYNELLISEFKDFKSGDEITVRIITEVYDTDDNSSGGSYHTHYSYVKMFFDKVATADNRVVLYGFDYEFERNSAHEKEKKGLSFYIDKNAIGNLGSVEVLPGFLTDEQFEKVLEFDPGIEEDKYLTDK
ncbi:MAG: hypothetical protein RI935_267 [Candidatus Parcubacteria bacterium]|jgi:hypothetical protein